MFTRDRHLDLSPGKYPQVESVVRFFYHSVQLSSNKLKNIYDCGYQQGIFTSTLHSERHIQFAQIKYIFKKYLFQDFSFFFFFGDSGSLHHSV